jgi:hypothetical protein
LNTAFDLKQLVIKEKVATHTLGVRLETDTKVTFPSGIKESGDMQHKKAQIIMIPLKKYTDFSLQNQIALDINPIAKTEVFGQGSRHCSTTFYQ